MTVDCKKTIMLVEDEAIIALVESRAIRGFGYDVVVASSGEGAIELVSGDGAIDLVLMDIDLGAGIDGPEAARRILKIREIPIVFLTGHSEQSCVESVKAITRYGYVVKRSSDFVLRSSIEMAFELFEANQSLRRERDELRKSEERCRTIIEKTIDYVYTVRFEGGRPVGTVHNPACAAVTGYSAEELASSAHLWLDMVVPEDRKRVEEYARGLGRGTSPQHVEHRIRRKDGAIRWIRDTSVPHFDSRGELASVDGIVVDVTDRKLDEENLRCLVEEKDALLKELRHRVKNSLSSLIGMLALQAETAEDPGTGDALRYARSRILCMEVLYDKLDLRDGRHSVLAREYFDEIIPNIFEALGPPREISIDTEIDDVLLPPDYFFPIGIIVNELVTNAVKHASRERERGSIRVSFRAPSDSECVLSVSDDGIGMPDSRSSGGKRDFGAFLVETLASQLGGKVEIGRGPGSTCSIAFPVENCVRATKARDSIRPPIGVA